MKAERFNNGDVRFTHVKPSKDGGMALVLEFGRKPEGFKGNQNAWYNQCKLEAQRLIAGNNREVTSTEEI